MRTFLVFLILLFLGFPESNSVAEELFLMRVVSVDAESGKISAEALDGPEPSTNGTGNPVRKPGVITVLMGSGRLPEQLHPGSVVRVWGEFSGETGVFSARKLFPGKTAGRGTDPTGVRRRLGKGRGFGGKGGGGHGHGRK